MVRACELGRFEGGRPSVPEALLLHTFTLSLDISWGEYLALPVSGHIRNMYKESSLQRIQRVLRLVCCPIEDIKYSRNTLFLAGGGGDWRVVFVTGW